MDTAMQNEPFIKQYAIIWTDGNHK